MNFENTPLYSKACGLDVGSVQQFRGWISISDNVLTTFFETVDIDDADFVHEYSFSKSLKEHDVEINSVNFKYRNSPEWIFDNLNLKIKKNSHTVITGQNGSGKSTLLGLISGMLIHQNGSIKIGRDKLGYIGPTPLILSTSLKENLLYGNTAVVDESKILETCEMFKLFDVVIKEIGKDRVMVSGASGYAPTNQYKVSATYMDGYRVAGTLVIGGKDAKEKGTLIANAIIDKVSHILANNNLEPFKKISFDLLGTDSIYGPDNSNSDSREIVLRLMATHVEKSALIFLSREMAQAVTGMPAGVINYLGGRPPVSPSIHLLSLIHI